MKFVLCPYIRPGHINGFYGITCLVVMGFDRPKRGSGGLRV